MSTPTAPRAWTVETGDGRRIGGVRLGRDDGRPVLFVHGAPASAENVRFLDLDGDAADAAGAALVAIDRPGIGATDALAQPAEDAAAGAAAAADDMAAVLDAFEWPRATVVVHSAGAFAAVTMASRYADRVERLVLIAGAAPDMGGPEAAGMEPQARAFFDLCRDRPNGAAMMLASLQVMLRLTPGALTRQVSRGLPPADAELVRDPRATAAFVAMLRRALARGRAGLIADGRIARGPWPVDAEAITAPVELYGGDQDRNVPLAVAEAWASRLSHATLHVVEGAGHISILPRVAGRVLAEEG